MKKWLALVLAVTLVASVGAGCAKTPKSEAGAKGVDDPSVTYTIDWAATGMNDATDDAYALKYVESKYNIKINKIGVAQDSWDEVMGARLGAGQIPDILGDAKISSEKLPMYAGQGVIMELPQEIIRQYMPKWSASLDKLDPKLWTYGIYEGKNWGIPLPEFRDIYTNAIAWNADWLKKVGATKIPETLQEFEDTFVKFRNDDPDGNGKKDTYALSTPSNRGNFEIFNEFFGAFGVSPFQFMEENGKLVYGFTKPETKDALKLLNKWYKMGLIDPEFITEDGRGDGNDLSWKFSTGKVGYVSTLDGGDNQWDNDGKLNFKWCQAHPDALKYVYVNGDKEKAELAYQAPFADLAAAPAGVYVNGKAPVGADGKSGMSIPGMTCKYILLGAHMGKPENAGKLERVLKMFDDMAMDKDTYIKSIYGEKENPGDPEFPNGIWSKYTHEKYGEYANFVPELYASGKLQTKPNRFSGVNPFNIYSKEMYIYQTGPKRAMRMEILEAICNGPKYENPVKAPLAALGTYGDHEKIIVQFIIKAITGESAVDGEWEKTVSTWKANGGDTITNEANEWYASVNK